MNKASLKKNILLISFVFSPNIGGVESHLDDLTNYMSKKGHAVTVITYKPLITKEDIPFWEKRNNITIIRIPWFHPNIFNKLERIPFIETLYLVPPIFFYSFFYILTHFRSIDVLQVHGFNMAIVGSILSVIFRKQLVINTHVSFYFQKESLYARILALFLRQARFILVLTKESREELIKIGIAEQKVLVYHQWIDEKTFSPKDKIKSCEILKLDKTKFNVLFVGRFSPAKGLSLLIEAASLLPKDFQVVFVGSGPLASFIQENAKRIPSIVFRGRVSYKDLPYYYSAADVVVIPSTPATQTYSEGIPRVMIEAYRCGTPVIATKVGGIKEHVSSKTGKFVKAKHADIANTLKDLFKQQSMLKKMGENAYDYAVFEFSFSKNAEIIEKSLL
jgi:glycosyltransferase involved in cell wall biosynthesis